MKLFFSIAMFSALNIFIAQGQVVNKSFIANIGVVCEETTKPDPCAGYNMYLILSFEKENVNIVEKNVRTCGTEIIKRKIKSKWKIDKNNEIKFLNPAELKDSFLEDLYLKLIDKKLVGYKKDWNNKLQQYSFKTNN